MYTIAVWPTEHKRHTVRVTSADILQRLDPSNPVHARAITNINYLEKHGCQYTNQHWDLLAYGHKLINPLY